MDTCFCIKLDDIYRRSPQTKLFFSRSTTHFSCDFFFRLWYNLKSENTNRYVHLQLMKKEKRPHFDGFLRCLLVRLKLVDCELCFWLTLAVKNAISVFVVIVVAFVLTAGLQVLFETCQSKQKVWNVSRSGEFVQICSICSFHLQVEKFRCCWQDLIWWL